jgi:hypothetical protein
MTREVFTRSILPIAILFSGSLILSNKAYLHLTVSFIQMLKVRVCPLIHPCRGPGWILMYSYRRPAGIQPRCNSPHPMDLPYPRHEPTAVRDRPHDLRRCLPRFLRRTPLQFVRLHHPEFGRRLRGIPARHDSSPPAWHEDGSVGLASLLCAGASLGC